MANCQCRYDCTDGTTSLQPPEFGFITWVAGSCLHEKPLVWILQSETINPLVEYFSILVECEYLSSSHHILGSHHDGRFIWLNSHSFFTVSMSVWPAFIIPAPRTFCRIQSGLQLFCSWGSPALSAAFLFIVMLCSCNSALNGKFWAFTMTLLNALQSVSWFVLLLIYGFLLIYA